MPDLTPEYLAGIRSAAECMHDEGELVIEQRWRTYAVTSQLYPLNSSEPVNVMWLCYADTQGGAEQIRTLLQAVPRLLAEVEHLRALDAASDEAGDILEDTLRETSHALAEVTEERDRLAVSLPMRSPPR